ncbi:phosphodiester glycosidase family protein [Rubrivirga sp.]|uniref:phosphodiester glycosidase family protein n=1 Tax=Rubrivirga sp. TaxID=1885344 RepID=UPI003C73E3EC
MTLLRLAACTVLLASIASAQTLTLDARPDAEEGVPRSVRVFDVTRAGTPLRASLIRADLSADDWELEAMLSDQGTETVPSFADETGVFAAINGGYYGGGQSFSLVLEDGVVASPNIKALTRDGQQFFPTRSAVGISSRRTPDVAWIYDVEGETYAYPQPSPNAPGAPQPQPDASFPDGGAPWDVTTAIGGGPVLVQDGRAALTWTEEVFFGGSGVDTTSSRARTAVGYTSDRRMLLVAVSEQNGLTLPELAQLMVDLGAVEALNLDGGGSTAMSAGGADLVRSNRPVASALLIRAPGGPTAGEETTFDAGGDGYRETGDWFESANAPFFGGTPSRLNEVGTGDDRAVFVLDGIRAGDYALDAWWTPAPNRATDTPFTVYSGGSSRTVRANQTLATSAGVWNRIGEFSLAPGDSVVVTDDASGSTSPAFVVVDGLRLVSLGATSSETDLEVRSLRVWPNPSAGAVSLEVEERSSLEVVDTLGRVVGRLDIGGPQRVEITGLAPGVYVVRATSGSASRTARFTIVR